MLGSVRNLSIFEALVCPSYFDLVVVVDVDVIIVVLIYLPIGWQCSHPMLVAAIIAAICVSVVPVQATCVVHKQRRRWSVRVDDLVLRAGRVHRMVVHGLMMWVMIMVWKAAVLLVVCAGRGGHLLSGCLIGDDRMACSRCGRHSLSDCGRVGARRGGMMHTAMRDMCNMWLRAARSTSCWLAWNFKFGKRFPVREIANCLVY